MAILTYRLLEKRDRTGGGEDVQLYPLTCGYCDIRVTGRRRGRGRGSERGERGKDVRGTSTLTSLATLTYGLLGNRGKGRGRRRCTCGYSGIRDYGRRRERDGDEGQHQRRSLVLILTFRYTVGGKRSLEVLRGRRVVGINPQLVNSTVECRYRGYQWLHLGRGTEEGFYYLSTVHATLTWVGIRRAAREVV